MNLCYTPFYMTLTIPMMSHSMCVSISSSSLSNGDLLWQPSDILTVVTRYPDSFTGHQVAFAFKEHLKQTSFRQKDKVKPQEQKKNKSKEIN